MNPVATTELDIGSSTQEIGNMAAQQNASLAAGAPAPTAPPVSSWPNTLAAKVLASYLHLRYGLSAADLQFFNPKMGALPFFNNSATAEVRHDELALVAAAILKFLREIGIAFQSGKDATSGHADLLTAMEPEMNRSSKMVAAIDANFRFMDENND